MPDWEKRFDTKPESHGIYDHIIAVSDRTLVDGDFEQQIETVCSLHPDSFLLMEPDLNDTEYYQLARKTLLITTLYGVSPILHSRLEVAEKLGISFIHLELDELRDADKNMLALFSKVGCTVRTLDQAIEARQLGATFLIAGDVYETEINPTSNPRGVDFVYNVSVVSRIPVYGAGGVEPTEISVNPILEKGAAGVAICKPFMQMK